MELADIVRQIRAEAQAEVDSLRRTHEAEARRLDAELEVEKARISDDMLKEAEAELAQQEREELGRARVERKNKLANRRKEIVDRLIREAVERYMKSGKYEAFLRQAVKNNYKKGMRVYARKGDAAAAKVLRAARIKFYHRDVDGGLIFKKGGVAVNKTVSVLVEKKKAELERVASSVLF